MSEAYAYDEDQKYTYADYKAWELKPRERYELIHGVAYAMAAPNTVHQRILITLGSEFHNFLKGKPCEVFIAPFDIRLFYEEDETDDTVVQPDVVVICDSKRLGTEGGRGAPDLVVEILSPSNSAIEMERKRLLYQDAGIREYWIVDPRNKNVNINLLKNGKFKQETLFINDTICSTVLSGLKMPLSTIFDEITAT